MGWLKNNNKLDVTLESKDHDVKKAIPNDVKKVPTKTAILLCSSPHTEDKRISKGRKEKKCAAFTIIILLPRCKWVFLSVLLINTLVMKCVVR